MEEEKYKITNDFLNNENPFILSNDEFIHTPKLEVLLTLQPKFIPYTINQSELKSKVKKYLEENCRNLINNIFYKFNVQSEEELENLNQSDEVLDALIQIKGYKLWYKQFSLREKVVNALSNTMNKEKFNEALKTKIPTEKEDFKNMDEIKRKLETECRKY